MFWRTLRLACVVSVVSVGLASACGGGSSNPGTDSSAGGGSAGKTAMAGSGATLTMMCGTATCKAVTIPLGDFTLSPCCADAATSQCGLDSSVLAQFGPTFPEACQPLNQPGARDAECPESVKTPVTGTSQAISFHGCCRGNGSCGYLLDKLGDIFPLGLGCVDSAPFLDGGTPSLCGGVGQGRAGSGG
ncbi:MAG: hypothetical protein ABIQ16_09810 [Polyangiaceae bacterium]